MHNNHSAKSLNHPEVVSQIKSTVQKLNKWTESLTNAILKSINFDDEDERKSIVSIIQTICTKAKEIEHFFTNVTQAPDFISRGDNLPSPFSLLSSPPKRVRSDMDFSRRPNALQALDSDKENNQLHIENFKKKFETLKQDFKEEYQLSEDLIQRNQELEAQVKDRDEKIRQLKADLRKQKKREDSLLENVDLGKWGYCPKSKYRLFKKNISPKIEKNEKLDFLNLENFKLGSLIFGPFCTQEEGVEIVYLGQWSQKQLEGKGERIEKNYLGNYVIYEKGDFSQGELHGYGYRIEINEEDGEYVVTGPGFFDNGEITSGLI